MTEVVLVERDGPVATLTLNRPERRNALDRALRDELRAQVAALEADPAIRVLVLTGADPAFCAGLDLRELEREGLGALNSSSDGPLGPRAKPVIGAVNGVAVTGGLELALACDFLVASERASFADTHTRVGIHPGWGLTPRLAEAVGVRRAREMTATNNYISAQTAELWGLVNRVVPHDRLMETVGEIAATVAANDSEAVRAIFETYLEVSGLPDREGVKIERVRARAWQADRTAAGTRAGAATATPRGRGR